MTFTSFTYLAFLSVFSVVYWCVSKKVRMRNTILVLASYFFYGFFSPWYCLLLLGSTLVSFWCIELLQKETWTSRKTVLAIAVTVNVSILAILKINNYFVANAGIIFPVGISFYALQSIALVTDVYMGKIRCNNFLEIATHLSFFPKLLAGPLEPATSFFPQIRESKKFKLYYVPEAVELLVIGFFKKLVIAENIRPFVDQIFELKTPSMSLLMIGTLGFAIQVLADFEGYTDIARGSARLLGFNLMENFRAPYLALTPSDYWNRWHISLSQWFRDYVYKPLGGSRGDANWKICGAFVATMALSGIWHGTGTNFLAWGIYHGMVLYLYFMIGRHGDWKPETKLESCVSWFLMMNITLIGWLLFRAPDMAWLGTALENMTWGLTREHLLLCLTWMMMFAFYVAPWIGCNFLRILGNEKVIFRIISNALMFTCIMYLSVETPADFVYFLF